MKQSRSDFLLALCSLSACVGVLYLVVEQNRRAIETPVAAQALQSPGPSDADTQALETKVAELTRNLDRTTAQLDHAMARLSENSTESRRSARSAEAMGQIPAPVMVNSGTDGRLLPSFEELLSPSGEPLASQVRFSGIYGRRLVFRDADNQPRAFDVEEVHPGVLEHLEIDLDAAREAARRTAENRRARAEAAARRRAEIAQAQAAEQARQIQAAPPAEASMATPAPQTTHITINQPAPQPSYYTTPVYYYWPQPVRRTPVRRNVIPGSGSGIQFNVGPVTANVGSSPTSAGSDAARFPYNQGFRFIQSGPYTTIPR